MTGLTSLYRLVKKFVGLFPSWLFRFRPFGRYQIVLPKSGVIVSETLHGAEDSRGKLTCEVRWVKASEAAILNRVATRESIAALHSPTRRAAAAWFDNEVIACAWVATGSFGERDLGLRFELQPSDAWLSAAVVDPLHRRRGVYLQLMEFLVTELSRSEIGRMLFGVSLGNEPSRRAHMRFGATQIGQIVAVRILGLTACWHRGRIRLLSPAFPLGRTVRLAVENSTL